MAITKLNHLKYDGGRGEGHLLRLLKYIQNPEKTAEGAYVWSNCGTAPQSQFEQMMETKKLYGKEDGRQAYYFVISFPPGEKITDDTAVAFGRDFCEKYFHGDYLDSYFAEMKRLGYQIGRHGMLDDYGEYVTYHATEEKGAGRGIRDRSLGTGYSLREISERIKNALNCDRMKMIFLIELCSDCYKCERGILQGKINEK